MIKGKLYGIGVGPGDPELMTLKAVRIITECDMAAGPLVNGENQTAFEIAKKAVPELEEKPFLSVPMPMTRDLKEANKNRDRAAKMIIEELSKGKDIAFLTLGDPTVYSTYLYLHQRVRKAGYDSQIIPGVPSFCAAAAALETSLVEGKEPLVIVPGSYECTEEMLSVPGNKVLMKTGRAFEEVKGLLKKHGLFDQTQMAEQCGMEGERVYHTLDEAPQNPHYFSVLLVKPGQEET